MYELTDVTDTMSDDAGAVLAPPSRGSDGRFVARPEGAPGGRRAERVGALARDVAGCLATSDVMSLEWRPAAACLGADPEIFFPERGQASDRAKAICLSCPVRIECLTWSVVTCERQGIWGGVAERTRRSLRRRLSTELSLARTA
ncbi:MAG TPA: WhiB family transcriptional regulator [Acidimicrobiales bacterium]|nr:WhiB family transcriptional regulator [Acidimicrobiales bacterium]